MTQLKTLAAVALLGLSAAACQSDMASTGMSSNAAATETLGADATGYKPITQIPGNSSYPNQPGVPGESVSPTRSPGAREASTIQP